MTRNVPFSYPKLLNMLAPIPVQLYVLADFVRSLYVQHQSNHLFRAIYTVH